MIRFQQIFCERAEEKQGLNFINSLEKDMLKPVPVESHSVLNFMNYGQKTGFCSPPVILPRTSSTR
jgi:hypothetical protein